MAFVILGLVLFGFLLRPYPEVLLLRTTTMSHDWQHRPCVEHDQIAIKAEICRLWILFIPTFGAVVLLVSLAVRGTAFLDYGWDGIVAVAISPPYWILTGVVITLLSAWTRERWTLRNAKVCSATRIVYHGGRVSYYFIDSDGQFFGGNGVNFTPPTPAQLASIVLYRADRPELNRIASGCLFHRLAIVANGITDLDGHTVKAWLRWPRWIRGWVGDGSAYSPAASLSASSSAWSRLMRPPGIDGSPALSFANASTLSLPLTSHMIFRARLITGYVIVMRLRP